MPHSSHSLARPVGYAVITAALVFLLLAAGLLIHEATRSPRLVRVYFPEIATLSEGDPVVQGGVPIGKVASIRLPENGSEAVVTIELFHHRPLAADARFINFSHSLMGARKVWLVPGVSTLPLDESRIQEGYFQPGLAETLHRVDSLVVLIARVREETERLLIEDNPLRAPLTAARRIDTAVLQLDKITGRVESARAALEAGIRGVRAAEPPLQSSLRQAAHLLKAVESVQKNLDTLLIGVEKMTAMAGDTTVVGTLLTSSAAYDNLEKSVRVLEKAAQVLKKDGLTDSVKIKVRRKNRG